MRRILRVLELEFKLARVDAVGDIRLHSMRKNVMLWHSLMWNIGNSAAIVAVALLPFVVPA